MSQPNLKVLPGGKAETDTQASQSAPQQLSPGQPQISRESSSVRVGSFNHVIFVVGVPGSGKSTYAACRSLGLAKAAYTVAHDPRWNIPDTLPSGKSLPIRRHRSVADAQRVMGRDARGIHAIATPDAGEVLNYGVEIAKKSIVAHGGENGIPVVCYIDEGVDLGGASPYRLGPEFRRLLAQRRHDNVGLLLTCQSPCYLHYAVLGQATEIVCFRLTHQKDLDALDRARVPQEVIARLPTLKNYEYIVFRLT